MDGNTKNNSAEEPRSRKCNVPANQRENSLSAPGSVTKFIKIWREKVLPLTLYIYKYKKIGAQ